MRPTDKKPQIISFSHKFLDPKDYIPGVGDGLPKQHLMSFGFVTQRPLTTLLFGQLASFVQYPTCPY